MSGFKGKGSRQRGLQVSQKEFDDNWDRIHNKSKITLSNDNEKVSLWIRVKTYFMYWLKVKMK